MKNDRIHRPAEVPAPKVDEGQNDLDLADVLTQLLARKGIILLCTLVGTMVGIVFGQLPPNMYRASALVQIEERSGGIALPSELIGEMYMGRENSGSLATEIHVIRSRLILDPVVEALRLDIHVSPVQAPYIGEVLMRRNIPFVDGLIPDRFARRDERLAVSELEFPAGTRAPVLLARVAEQGVLELSLDGDVVATGPAPGTITLPGGGSVTVTHLEAPPGREFVIRQRSFREAAAAIRSGLSVSERNFTGIVDFSVTGTSRDDVIGIVNAVIESYQDQNLRRRAAEIDQSIAFIESQLPEVQASLTEATEDLRIFRRDRQVEELSRSTQDILSRMVQIETRLEELSFRKEQTLQRVTVNHPDYLALVSEEELLRGRLESLRTDLGDVPETERELANLTAQLERARQLEIQLVGRTEQLRVLRASTVSNIRVLEAAETAPHVGPDRRTPIAFWGFIGFIASVLGLLGINLLRRGIDNVAAVEALGLSLFSTIEKVPALSAIKPSDPRYGVALDQPQSMASEAFRGLRTGLRFSLAATGSKSLMITSCAPGDGKSFVSLNLALVSGQAGARVLLIDADMRRGFLRQYFNVGRRDPGLSDLLAGNSDLDTMLHHHAASGIDFLSSGSFPPNPAELLAGPILPQFLEYANGVYDLVIVDAPPVLAVADPGIIGQHVGMSLLVIRHLVTTAPEVQGSMKTLANAGVSLSGVVLNQFDQRGSRYGAYGRRYGYYSGGYSYSAN